MSTTNKRDPIYYGDIISGKPVLYRHHIGFNLVTSPPDVKIVKGRKLNRRVMNKVSCYTIADKDFNIWYITTQSAKRIRAVLIEKESIW